MNTISFRSEQMKHLCLMRFPLLLFILTLQQFAFAGQLSDSLKQVLPSQAGEERVRTLNQLAYHLRYSDLETALESAHEANELSEELKTDVS